MQAPPRVVSRRLRGIVLGADLYAVRALLGFAELVWAFALFWPGETFDRPTYRLMGLAAGETVWAWVFLATGLLQWAILFSGGHHGGPAALFAAWNSALWTFCVAAMYLSVYPPPAAISDELSLAAGAWWVFARTGLACGHVERRHHGGAAHA